MEHLFSQSVEVGVSSGWNFTGRLAAREVSVVPEQPNPEGAPLPPAPPRPPRKPSSEDNIIRQQHYALLRQDPTSYPHWHAIYQVMFEWLRYHGREWGGPGTDLAQETLIALHQHLQKTATGRTNVNALVGTILKRKKIDYLRRHEVRKEKLAELIREALINATTAPLAAGENRRQLETVAAAVAAVRGQVLSSTNPNKYRCFEECTLNGRKAEDVARELGVSAQVVYNNVNRIKEAIRETALRLARETATDPSAVNNWPGSYYMEHRAGPEDFPPDSSAGPPAHEIQ